MPDYEPITVLIVDEENCQDIADQLRVAGAVTCFEARSAVHAFSLAQKHGRFDVVVMDMKLPLSNTDPAYGESDELRNQFKEFSGIYNEGSLYDPNGYPIGGWWCAAFLLEKLNAVDRENIIYATSHTKREHFEPFKKTDKLGLFIRQRETILEDSKTFIERLANRRFLDWIQDMVESEALDREFIRRFEDALRQRNWDMLTNLFNLKRYFPYSNAHNTFADVETIADHIRQLLAIPDSISATLLPRLLPVYGHQGQREKAWEAASAMLIDIMDENVILHSDDEPDERDEYIDRVREETPDRLQQKNLLTFVAARLGGREAALKECVERLILIALFADRGDITKLGRLSLDDKAVYDLDIKLGFAKFDKLDTKTEKMIYSVGHFRKVMSTLCLTADGQRTPLVEAHFLPEEKEWLLNVYKKQWIRKKDVKKDDQKLFQM